MVKNTNEKNKGITLISLVVTIIILLILAGVSLYMILGNNGLINKSKTAKMQYTSSDIKEKIKLAISDKEVEKEGSATLNDLDDITIQGYNEVNVGSIGRIITVKAGGENYAFWVDSNLKVSDFQGNINQAFDTGSTNTTIKDFTPNISDVNGTYFTITANAESDDSTVVAYEYFVNNEYKGITLADTSNKQDVTNLDVDTSYPVYVIALDDKGTIKKSAVVNQKTLDKLFLYKDGDECTLVTGGWTTTIQLRSASGKKNPTNLYMYAGVDTGRYTTYGFRTSKKIDFSKYSTIHATISSSINGGSNGGLTRTVGLWDGTTYWVFDGENYDVKYAKGIRDVINNYDGSTSYNINKIGRSSDISGTDALYYLTTSVCAGGCGETLDLTIHEIWVEK